MDSLNGLDKLLDAEAKAAALIKDAETEAASIASKAIEDAHKKEKERLGGLNAEKESAIAAFREATESKLKVALDEYGKTLASLPQDQDALALACRSFMSAEA